MVGQHVPGNQMLNDVANPRPIAYESLQDLYKGQSDVTHDPIQYGAISLPQVDGFVATRRVGESNWYPTNLEPSKICKVTLAAPKASSQGV